MKNFARIISNQIKDSISASSIVLLTGFKGSGKSFLGGKFSSSSISFSSSNNKEYLYTADAKPLNLLLGDYPRLIDGIEVKEKMLDACVLFSSTKNDGKFILTSSKKISSSSNLASFSTVFVYPMSLYESKESNGNVSLSSLFDRKKIEPTKLISTLSLDQLIFSTCRGGFPKSLEVIDKEEKLKVAKSYLTKSLKSELSLASLNKRDYSTALSIIKSYSKNLFSFEKNTFLLESAKKEKSLSKTTYYAYKKALEDIFLLNEIKPWNLSLRSKGVIISASKRCLIDPSLAIAALNLKPDDFKTSLLRFSYLFKNLVARDLLVYSQKLGGKLYYYSDRYGLDVDLVLELNDGRYALINVELGSFDIDASSKRLNKLEELILSYNKENKKYPLMEPTLKLIITASPRGSVRDDGVVVVPIGCLKD